MFFEKIFFENIFENFKKEIFTTIKKEIRSKFDSETTIEIISISGKVLHQSMHNVSKGANKFSFETSHLSQGVYFLRIYNENEVKEVKFIK